MTVPRFQKFLLTSKAVKTHLYFRNSPLEVNPQLNQNLNQSTLVLPPVFSHMDFLLIQALSESGYGTFHVTMEKKNHEFVVYLNSHLSQRYFLSKQESETMNEAYQQILKNWQRWWFSEFRD